MTTGLSDKQLGEAFNNALADFATEDDLYDHEWDRRAKELGLRAVADLAITHLEAENHYLRQKLAAEGKDY